MRVIAGIYKGRKLNSPKGGAVRPTSDKIKGAIFNILGDIGGKIAVDLFSGSGALGVEALSRGCKKVLFCDADRAAIDLTLSNLTFVEKKKYEVSRGDFAENVRRLKNEGVIADIIFCDAPYSMNKDAEILRSVAQSGILRKGGVLVSERDARGEPADASGFCRTDIRRYGNTRVEFYRNLSACAVTGTFDPFTLGHRFLVETALKRFDLVYAAVLINENKTMTYPLRERLNMIKESLKDLGDRVKIENYGGMAVDYCKMRGVRYIIRGVRDEKDLSFEREMADYNFRRGGITTLLVPAKEPEISSTLVKTRVAGGGTVEGLVDENIIELL